MSSTSNNSLAKDLAFTALCAAAGCVGAGALYAGASTAATIGFLPIMACGASVFTGGYLIYWILDQGKSGPGAYVRGLAQMQIKSIGSLLGGLALPAAGLYFAGYSITVLGAMGFTLSICTPTITFFALSIVFDE